MLHFALDQQGRYCKIKQPKLTLMKPEQALCVIQVDVCMTTCYCTQTHNPRKCALQKNSARWHVPNTVRNKTKHCTSG